MSHRVPYAADMTTNMSPVDTAVSTASDPAAELISRAETVRRLGISHTTLDRYLAEGILTAIKTTVGRRTWLPAADVERVRRARLGLDS
jgi:hypothetical protein